MKQLFSPSQFTPTEWNTAEDKAKFANNFVNFVESDMPRSKFYKWFYNRLSNCFYHIAHYNIHGFFDTWFSIPAQKARFIQKALDNPCYGDPASTYSDVEKALQEWLRSTNLLEKYREEDRIAVESRELELLATLKVKYE